VRGKIFISYRRDDAPGDARGIHDALVRAFGKSNVFMDVDNLLAGQRFDKELERALSQCDVLIAVIGPRWKELLSARLQGSARDYVRDEIAAALKRGVTVITVRVGHEAKMPPLPLEDELPESIRDLLMHQKHDVTHERFRRDVADLAEAISIVRKGDRKRSLWAGMAGVALASLIIGSVAGYQSGWFDFRSPRPPAEAEEKQRAEAEAARKASEEEAQRKAGEETKRKADEDGQRKAEEEAKRKADDEETQRRAQEEAKRKADEEAQRRAQEEAKKKADEEARRKAEQDAKRAEEEAQRKAPEERWAELRAPIPVSGCLSMWSSYPKNSKLAALLYGNKDAYDRLARAKIKIELVSYHGVSNVWAAMELWAKIKANDNIDLLVDCSADKTLVLIAKKYDF
jgi:hypothetical protein